MRKFNNPNPLSGAINLKVPDKGFRVSAFTLVELIVVITILAILATIGFVSFSGYLAGTRDTNRVAQLKSMSDALELYRTKKDLPIPDDKVDIKVGTGSDEKVIAYQGYIGKNVLETIEYTESGLDPKYKQYFSYYLTKDKKYFQLLAFLEEESDDTVALKAPDKGFGVNKTFAGDYTDKYPHVQGKKLGILLDTENNPIQEVASVTGSGYLNVEYTIDEYKSFIGNEKDNFITGTGSKLLALKYFTKKGGKYCSSTNLICTEVNGEFGWNVIYKDITLEELSLLGDISEIKDTFYHDSKKGIGWGTNDDTNKMFTINKNYSKVKVVFSGDYNEPSGGLGYLNIDNQDLGDSKDIISFRDAWTNTSEGQRLDINGVMIYKDQINELNREEVINYGDSTNIRIWMKGYTSSYPYTKRYIKELWIK